MIQEKVLGRHCRPVTPAVHGDATSPSQLENMQKPTCSHSEPYIEGCKPFKASQRPVGQKEAPSVDPSRCRIGGPVKPIAERLTVDDIWQVCRENHVRRSRHFGTTELWGRERYHMYLAPIGEFLRWSGFCRSFGLEPASFLLKQQSRLQSQMRSHSSSFSSASSQQAMYVKLLRVAMVIPFHCSCMSLNAKPRSYPGLSPSLA